MTLNDVVVDPALPESTVPEIDVPETDVPETDVSESDIPETDAPAGPTFADLPLGPELQRAVAALGYTIPTPIQAEAIAPLVEGRDLIGQAATGTGKTAAFALPMLERLGEQRPAAHRPHGAVRSRPRPDPRARAAGHRGDHAVRPGHGRARPHRLRRCPRRPAAARPVRGRRRRRGHPRPGDRPHEPRRAAARRARRRRARRGRRDARHGLRGGHRDPPRRHPGHPPGRAVLRDDAAPHRGPRAELPARAGHRADGPRGGSRG